MAVSGFVGRRNIQKISVELIFPEEVYVNTTFPLKVIINNKKRFMPSFLIRVSIGQKTVLFPIVEGLTEKVVEFKVEKRGVFKIDKINICSVFPFSFFVRCSVQKTDIKKTVFPEPKKCSIQHYIADNTTYKKGEQSSNIKGYEGELISVKDHTQTTPVKYIHWKASAKSDTLKEKELSQIQSPPVIIKFDKVNIPNLEEKLSCLTYTIIRHGIFDTDMFIEFEKELYNIKLKHDRMKILEKFAEL